MDSWPNRGYFANVRSRLLSRSSPIRSRPQWKRIASQKLPWQRACRQAAGLLIASSIPGIRASRCTLCNAPLWRWVDSFALSLRDCHTLRPTMKIIRVRERHAAAKSPISIRLVPDQVAAAKKIARRNRSITRRNCACGLLKVSGVKRSGISLWPAMGSPAGPRRKGFPLRLPKFDLS